ncbi:MAG: AAA family ATPase [Amoebophilaceae bacterium]|nr:AAA family ATPase [Amoebophilaceae bacterium]
MLSFKDVKANSFKGAYNAIYELIRAVYDLFNFLLKSDKLTDLQRNKFISILDKKSDQQQLEASLKLLSECLHKHHGKRVYILIDEYDTPLNQAYGNASYLTDLVGFMRNLFSSCLKGNNALARGLLTGILRVSNDSMLSGLNNLTTYTMLDKAYSSHFGFSDEEMQAMMHWWVNVA